MWGYCLCEHEGDFRAEQPRRAYGDEGGVHRSWFSSKIRPIKIAPGCTY